MSRKAGWSDGAASKARTDPGATDRNGRLVTGSDAPPDKY